VEEEDTDEKNVKLVESLNWNNNESCRDVKVTKVCENEVCLSEVKGVTVDENI
jgi:hypothetical protein